MRALNVVQIRDGQPSLQNIAGWLRLQADKIEALAPDDNDVRTLVIVTQTVSGAIPPPCCYGDNPSRSELVGLLHMAAIKAATGDWDETE